MATPHISRMVAGCVVGGVVLALSLVLGPLAGAQEPVITGAVLLAVAASWALMAGLTTLRSDQPQRWAFGLASFLAVAGAALWVCAPNDTVLGALGWVWPPLLLALLARATIAVRRDLRSRSRTWVVYPVFVLYALAALGGMYQTVRDATERRSDSAPGQLIDVGGRRLHLDCAGSGAPTVILESGLGETGAYWAWISSAVARETTVCVYDRAGRGWSDPTPVAQDGTGVANDLHALLDHAHLQGPFVLVGHSSGAQYVRIFAQRYPEQLAGVVFLDGQPAEAFEGLPAYPAFYSVFRRVVGLLPSLARLGVGRLIPADRDLPQPARDTQRRHHASPRLYRSLRDEVIELPTALAQARSLRTFGDRPLVVVTAAQDAQPGWLPLQDAMATLSTNSSHRVVPFTHNAVIMDETAAQTSIQAVHDVVHAVQCSVRLDKGGAE